MQIKLIVVVVDCSPTSWTEPWERASYFDTEAEWYKTKEMVLRLCCGGRCSLHFFMIIYISFRLSILHVALKRLIDDGFV